MGDNGEIKKEEQKFKHHIFIGLGENGEYVLQTNVNDLVMGYGMLEMAKSGVANHIINLAKNQNKIIPAKGGIMNFIRRN